MAIEIMPLMGLPEIGPSSNLGEILCEAMKDHSPLVTDVLVVTQKIVSKAEGRIFSLDSILPGEEALRLATVVRKDPRFVELVLAESTAVVRAVPHVLITRHRTGHVMANAGIDRSNLGPGGEDKVLLLPKDADLSAERLRACIAQLGGISLPLVITDSFGRPWRKGVVNVAIGAAGLPSILDCRGDPDRDGRLLEVTEIGLADMIASAAGLAMGEGSEGIPAVLVRGLRLPADANPAAMVCRPAAEDLFQ
jgi:coenzyme F420-0:L-glutamate ligase/coenzyme F420-1:gamma-L-glutamate ligase